MDLKFDDLWPLSYYLLIYNGIIFKKYVNLFLSTYKKLIN